MKIAIVTIGDELLNGDVIDTNTADIAQSLRCAGYEVDQAITLKDAPQQIAETLQQLNKNNILAIVCGGLGPTRDDVTARAAAQAYHLTLALNDTALEQIKNFFQRSGRPLAAGNEKQALIPHKAKVMENLCGTAPGFIVSHNKCHAFFMPGVPHEMRDMLQRQVLPTLKHLIKPTLYCAERVLKVFGLPEAAIEREIPTNLFATEIALSFRLEFPLVLVKLNSQGHDQSLLDQAEQLVRQKLGQHVVAQGDETLAEVVANKLHAAEKTLSVAESCTGGLIAKLLTDCAGSSAFFERGAITYSNSAKHAMLGVDEQLLLDKGAVSYECAQAMANGIRQQSKTDFSLAVTGIAGPGGGTAEKPCGTVFIALASYQGTEVRECHFSGDRTQVRIKTAYTALDWLLKQL